MQTQPLAPLEQGQGTSTADLASFESEMEQTLVYMPLRMRFAMDIAGVRLSLDQWQRLAHSDRRLLAALPHADRRNIERFVSLLVTLIACSDGGEVARVPIDPCALWTYMTPQQTIVGAAMAQGFQLSAATR